MCGPAGVPPPCASANSIKVCEYPVAASFNDVLGDLALVEDMAPGERAQHFLDIADRCKCGARAESFQATPLPPAAFEGFCCGHMRRTARAFRADANFISQPVVVDRQFPEVVQYPGHCEGICRSSSQACDLLLEKRLVAFFHSLPQRMGVPPASMAFEDLVMLVQCFDEVVVGGQTKVDVSSAMVLACGPCAGQSGRHAPVELFFDLESVSKPAPLTLDGMVG